MMNIHKEYVPNYMLILNFGKTDASIVTIFFVQLFAIKSFIQKQVYEEFGFYISNTPHQCRQPLIKNKF